MFHIAFIALSDAYRGEALKLFENHPSQYFFDITVLADYAKLYFTIIFINQANECTNVIFY